jgi:preprotein translocase subunit SecD
VNRQDAAWAVAWLLFVAGAPESFAAPAAEALRFEVDLAEARAAGRALAGDSDTDLRSEALKGVQARLAKLGVPPRAIVLDRHGVIEVTVTKQDDRKAILSSLSRRGEVEFRIEVFATYSSFRLDLGRFTERSPRANIWTGARGKSPEGAPVEFPPTSEGFEEFKIAEVARYEAAATKQARYAPLDSRYRVVPQLPERPDLLPIPSDPGMPDLPDPLVRLRPARAYVIVQESDPVLGNELLANWDLRTDNVGDPAVAFEVAPEKRAVLRAFTSKNLDLPLAVVIDGSVFSRPTISTVLSDELQLCFPYHLKGPDPKTQESEAKALGAALTGRPMRVRLLHKTAEDR